MSTDQQDPTYVYNDAFFRYINEGSTRSARHIVPALLQKLGVAVDSVLDVGCGAGAWLSVWQEQGVDVTGLDNDYVNRNSLLIEASRFIARDLSEGFDLGRRFDVAQSLEVAEHLPESSAALFVQSLCKHADIVLFSAAPPGQGGENHINEQPYGYWRDIFAQQGYRMYDCLRRDFLQHAEVMPWYRYNLFVYINETAHAELHQALVPCQVPEGQTPPDLSPAIYKARKKMISLLPTSASTGIAMLKKTLLNLRNRRAA